MNTVASLPAKLTDLVRRLRDGDWNMRTPEELAECVADAIMEALATPAVEGDDVDYVCSALGNLFAGDKLDKADAAIIDRARLLIRRLATPEQTGSAVQGEAVAIALHRAYNGMLDDPGFPDGWPGWKGATPEEREFFRRHAAEVTTPPPAPAATYATPDDVALTMGPDDIPHLLIAGAEVARFPKGSWAEVCEAFDFGGYRHEPPAPAAEQVYHGDVPNFDLPVQPEARGVEGMVLVPRVKLLELADMLYDNRTTTDSGLPVTVRECIDVAQAAAQELRRYATPNPVRAEQPEWKGAEFRGLDASGRPVYGRAKAEPVTAAPTSAPAAPVGVDELCREARELQRQNYGHGMGLHLAMIEWAEKYDAALAGKDSDHD